jgi:hypothetical protein
MSKKPGATVTFQDEETYEEFRRAMSETRWRLCDPEAETLLHALAAAKTRIVELEKRIADLEAELGEKRSVRASDVLPVLTGHARVLEQLRTAVLRLEALVAKQSNRIAQLEHLKGDGGL